MLTTIDSARAPITGLAANRAPGETSSSYDVVKLPRDENEIVVGEI